MASSRSARAGLVGAAAAALLLAACAPAPMLQPPEAAERSQPEQPADGLAPYYEQELDWTECGDRHECARLSVPLDYDDPGGQSIEIALKVAPATGSAQGPLVLNPGGPGGSGVELVESVDATFSDDVVAAFDIVGFDPRGVGDSDAVRCLDDDELDEYYATGFNPDSDAGWQDFLDSEAAYGEACAERTGTLLGFVDTDSSARDLDILRAALGQEELTYLGYSYGTYLGAVYAELFPGHVGRFVLDSAMDPSLSYAEVVRGQVGGFDQAYRSYLSDCMAGPECPFSGSQDEAVQDTIDLLSMLGSDPVPAGDPDRPVTDADLFNAIMISMYNVQYWPVLTEAITMLMRDEDASVIRNMSDLALEREEDGSYRPDEGAFRAINCLDYPIDEVDREDSVEAAEQLVDLSPVFGRYMGYGEVGCATWPHESENTRAPIAASGTPPILVIGITRDPATPHEWAEALAEQLEAGIMLSYDGDGHTAYGTGNSCVHDAVDDFLLEGQVPPDGTEC